MRLLESPDLRQDLIAVLQKNASARWRLRQFMGSSTLGARLRCFEGYLQEQSALDPLSQ